MEDGKPTGDGASTIDRIEAFLTAEETPEQQPLDDEETAEVVDDQPESDAGEQDQETLSTADLAKYLGIDDAMLDLDESGSVLLKTKIDGQEGKANLKDLLASYQLRGHLDNETRKVAEQQKLLAQQQAEAEQAVQTRLQQLEGLTQLAHSQLMAEFQGIDWQALQAEDPGRYSAMLLNFQGRQQQINQAVQQIHQERAKAELSQQEQVQHTIAEEAKRLSALIPEWNDAEVAKREKAELREYMLKNGYTEQEIASVAKAAYVNTLRKAMLYDRLQAAKPAVENKVKAAPKLVKPGQAQQANQNQQITKLKAQFKKSGGKVADAASLLLATGKV